MAGFRLAVFRLTFYLGSHLYGVFQHAPTNSLIARLRTRQGLRWAIPVALVLVAAYLYTGSIVTTVLEDGGPGWLNLLVLLLCWNAIKFAAMIPVRLVLLARVRFIEWRARPALAEYSPMERRA